MKPNRRRARPVTLALYIAMAVMLLAQAPLEVGGAWHRVLELAIFAGSMVVLAYWTREHQARTGSLARRGMLTAGKPDEGPISGLQCAAP